MLGPDHFGSHGQHNGCLVHQQGGGYEIRLSLCPPLETAFLVQPQADGATGQAHSGKIECDSGQTVQTQTSDPDRVIPPTGDLRPLVCKVAHSSGRSFCHQVQSQTSLVPDPQAWQVDALSLNLEGLDAYAFPPVSLLGKLVSKVLDQGVRRLVLIAPGWPNMPWFWDLVNMSVQVPLPSASRESVDPTVQSISAHRSSRSQPACLAPRASSIQAQGFSDEVATRIKAPQRQSTRAVYDSKWTIFIK